MKSENKSITKHAAVIGGATLASRILGFIRDAVIATILGAGAGADAFFVAFRLPNLLRRLFGEGSLVMAFVPVYTKVREQNGPKDAFAFARAMQFWLLCCLAVLTLLALIFMKPLILILAPGFAKSPEKLTLAVELARISFPYVLFIASIALYMGILNANKHFLAPALAPCILNIMLILSCLTGFLLDISIPHCLAVGVLLAGVLQWLAQQPALKSTGFSFKGNYPLKHPALARTGKLMLPTIVGAAAYQLTIVIGTVLSSLLGEGSISFLYYADRLVQLPLGIFGVAIATAALPSLASLTRPEKKQEFKETLAHAFSLTLFVSIPSAAGLIALAEPIVQTLFGRGEFDHTAVKNTASALIAFSCGLPAYAVIRPLVSACYAKEDTKTPVIIAVICLIIYTVSGYILMQFMAHTGLALASALTAWMNALLLLFVLYKKLGAWGAFHKQTFKFMVLALLMGLGASFTSHLGIFAVLSIPFWALLYGISTFLLGVPEAKIFVQAIQRCLYRKKNRV